MSKPAEAIAKAFHIENISEIPPHYNIAPTQLVPAVLHIEEKPNRELKMLRWGLIPSWAKDKKIGAKLINARAETVTEKPAFRSAFRHRRCLIVADGFYEWQHKDGKKQPYYFRMSFGQLLGFAGLWEQWKNPEGEIIESCTILTTEANDLMRPIHNRMPVIIEPQDYDLWLRPEAQKYHLLQPLLHPYPSIEMTVYPVSTDVNKVTNDSLECTNSI